jgi:hypothetical protein
MIWPSTRNDRAGIIDTGWLFKKESVDDTKMKIKDAIFIICETMQKNLELAAELLTPKFEPKEARELALAIGQADPYQDKRMSVKLAKTIMNRGTREQAIDFLNKIGPELKRYKKIMSEIDSHPVPEDAFDSDEDSRKSQYKSIMRDAEKLFYDDVFDREKMSKWNDLAEKFMDRENYEDPELEVYDKEEDDKKIYRVYEIKNLSQCDSKIMKNICSYCILKKDGFGTHGGPPYYIVIATSKKGKKIPRQYAAICPNGMDGKIEITDSLNKGPLSKENQEPIKRIIERIKSEFDDKVRERIMNGDVYESDISILVKSIDFQKLMKSRNYKMEEKINIIIFEEIKKDRNLAMRLLMVSRNDLFWRDYPEVEKYIAKDPLSNYRYATSFLKKAWTELDQPENENYLMENPKVAYYYANQLYAPLNSSFVKARDGMKPNIEDCFKKDIELLYLYATRILRAPYSEFGLGYLEDEFEGHQQSLAYCMTVLKKSWKDHGREDMHEKLLKSVHGDYYRSAFKL